ncbi:MAG: ral nucleoside transport system permease protein [Gaiellaceae bacterium]|nr:ral nucleoside transport system permease protein [Gaiellaceae bacterium]
MTEPVQGANDGEQPKGEPGGYAPSVAERLAFYQRAGGIVTPLFTVLLAFLAGGLVVLATGHNPLKTYQAVWNGTGLQWFFSFGHYHIDVPFTHHRVFFWWDTNNNLLAAYNLSQTLILTTTLICTGLAVAFAFRCGLFNIGGQGQYITGAIVSVWVGSSWAGMAKGLHVFLAIALAMAAGAGIAALAGFLKASVGAHEVITTIMLNWIAYWMGSFLFGRGGPLQNSVDVSVPISNDIARSAKLPTFWGNPELQALHVGFFIALAALVVFWLTLNRTTLGYQVRAVGFNPEAARYGGINVARNYVYAMAISGAFAGLGGAIDILGWQYRLGVLDIQVSNIGFIGIAVALLGRNTALGVGLAALLFGSLVNGTSTRGLDPTVFPPQLAGNLTLMIQALVLLFVGADVLILYAWQARKKLGFGRSQPPPAAQQGVTT